MSETNYIRARVLPYILAKSDGVDLGFGGSAITPNAICVDLRDPYTSVGHDPQHLHGDATNLYWFKDNSLDFVYSSHLLEDFADTRSVLTEWLRVLKPGGRLLLYLPDEQVFRKHCAETGQPYNYAHMVPDMSLDYMLKVFLDLNVKEIHSELSPPYSFLIIGSK